MINKLLNGCCLMIFLIATAHATTDTSSQHEFHHPEQFLSSIKDDPEAGKKIYLKFCANCHDVKPIIPLGAPRIRVSEDWKPRMTRNIDQMLAKIDPGFNAMPARGGCFECSDAQLKAAIAYMLPDTK